MVWIPRECAKPLECCRAKAEQLVRPEDIELFRCSQCGKQVAVEACDVRPHLRAVLQLAHERILGKVVQQIEGNDGVAEAFERPLAV